MATTHVAFVLDRSGSMANIRTETVRVFNEQLEKTREIAEQVTLVTFSYEADSPRFISAASPLALEDYVPVGGTALYDAIGQTVQMLQAVEQTDPDTAYLVIIITDGYENASRNFERSKLASLIKELQGTDRWTFAYLGTEQDIFKVQETLNIPASNASTFARDTVAQLNSTGYMLASGIHCYSESRKKGATYSANFFSKPI